MNATKTPGRLLAWTSLLVGLVASVAANVAFARPAIGPRLSAAVAPVLVVLAAGLLERVQLAGVAWYKRAAVYLGLGVVAIAAFATSYQHQHDLLLAYGNPPLAAVLLPGAVDGIIVAASVCLTVIADQRRPPTVAAPVAKVAATAGGTRKVAATATRPDGNAAKVAALLVARPDIPAADVAAETGLAVRTARRHMATARAATATA